MRWDALDTALWRTKIARHAADADAVASLIRRGGDTYASVARRSGLQARTVRMIATGETPIERVSVGTIRQLASALGVSPAQLIEPEAPYPGDPSLTRPERLARAVREVMWGGASPTDYPSPVEEGDDVLARVEPPDFFAGTQPIDADRA